ncbi:hypothetical protein ACLMJK_009466 [Lecanora helva]
MKLPLTTLSISLLLTLTPAANIILPQNDAPFLPSNSTSLTNSTALPYNSTALETNGNRFIDKIKDLTENISLKYPSAYLIMLWGGVNPTTGKYTTIQAAFNDVARRRNRALIVTLGSDGWWQVPVIKDLDFSSTNKYLFRSALALDVLDAVKLMKRRFPRAQFTNFGLYWPKRALGMRDQPYWMFTMVRSVMWDKYVFVGVFDFQVSQSNTFPESGVGGGGIAGLAVS